MHAPPASAPPSRCAPYPRLFIWSEWFSGVFGSCPRVWLGGVGVWGGGAPGLWGVGPGLGRVVVGGVVWGCGWGVGGFGGIMRGRARDTGRCCGWVGLCVMYSLVSATQPGSEAEAKRSGQLECAASTGSVLS
ncbi:hypothetical protein D3230_11420 [Leucobacter chromiireducens subsp. solipictus]|uniref:Uncharacterized protein n=1 Tax=Leucobacter chromiireducens subsp. solipictus TaxID=398235 RepID=A0ABS1SK75_9MICO|nr:hypothetical protein [Leucobacter chromiireducens subsp. solipictus]